MEDDSKPDDQVASSEVADKTAEAVAGDPSTEATTETPADAPAAKKTECPEVAADDGTEESPPKKVKTTDEKIAETTETAKST